MALGVFFTFCTCNLSITHVYKWKRLILKTPFQFQYILSAEAPLRVLKGRAGAVYALYRENEWFNGLVPDYWDLVTQLSHAEIFFDNLSAKNL